MKNQYIKFRVTEEEKAELIILEEREHKTLTSYLLQRGLAQKEDMEGFSLSEKIELFDFLNEIYHEIQKSSDEKLKADIQMFCQKKFKRLWKAEK